MKITNKLILENSLALNVLYVEDDDYLRKATSKLFGNYFKSVDVALDGQDGLEKYLSYNDLNNEPYDIVISDIRMPNLNGLEMSSKIKDTCPEQEIIFVTAFNETEYLHAAIKIGIDAFLTKPLEIAQLNEVLYTASQAVVDRKLVKQHYKQIEDENVRSINLHDASFFDKAKDILDDLIENKDKISQMWVDNKIVLERLEPHKIDVEFFRATYGIHVMEYFLNVVKGDAEVGNCPVIFEMLEFFKDKELPLEDIFMVCVQFKNTVSSYIFSKYSFKQELFDDVSLILDKNFEGVIINYLKLEK